MSTRAHGPSTFGTPSLPTLCIRDGLSKVSSSPRHTLAGFPPGNLPATLRAKEPLR